MWWRLFLEGALRHPWVFSAEDHAAVSVWIPPGEAELSEEQGERSRDLLRELAGGRAAEIETLLGRFEATHPEAPEHFYLSLLGTHPDHRGKGLGMALLADNLARTDAAGRPAYLESSNPANDPRYERLGFTRVGSFDRPDGLLRVSTMWRPAAGGAAG